MNSTASTRIELPGSRGAQLAGRLDLPETSPRAYALFAHCFTCTTDVLAASRIAQALTSFGIAVLRFEVTGHGGSGGDFVNTDFTPNVGDLISATEYLRHHHQAPEILVGHSLGGSAVLAAAEHVPETRAVATIDAPAGADHLLHQAQAERIQRLGVPLLVMHSPNVETAGVENVLKNFDVARHPKSFVSLGGADHLLTRPDHARFAASVLATWASRYVSENAVSAAQPTNSAALPSPYDLLPAGLGACTSVTPRMYAARKGWPLDDVSVALRHSRIHAKDCADSTTLAPDGTLPRVADDAIATTVEARA